MLFKWISSFLFVGIYAQSSWANPDVMVRLKLQQGKAKRAVKSGSGGLQCGEMRGKGVGSVLYSARLNLQNQWSAHQRLKPDNSGDCDIVKFETILERYPCLKPQFNKAAEVLRSYLPEKKNIFYRVQVLSVDGKIPDHYSYLGRAKNAMNRAWKKMTNSRKHQCKVELAIVKNLVTEKGIEILSQNKLKEYDSHQTEAQSTESQN
ncbi:MAG: hypothetical protein KDD33_05455 [Bdellovibrionales bacterium]|nr:hypothetical protein [Bdellovibrionales bacterium]